MENLSLGKKSKMVVAVVIAVIALVLYFFSVNIAGMEQTRAVAFTIFTTFFASGTFFIFSSSVPPTHQVIAYGLFIVGAGLLLVGLDHAIILH